MRRACGDSRRTFHEILAQDAIMNDACNTRRHASSRNVAGSVPLNREYNGVNRAGLH